MRARRHNLEIVFKDVLPEQVVRGLLSSKSDSNNFPRCSYIPEEMFLRLSGWSKSGYSIDEREEQYKLMCSDMKKGYKEHESEPSVFNLVYSFANAVLRCDRFIPVCKYTELLKWQDTSHQLGQDLFTTAYLAVQDYNNNTITDNFAWNPIINNTNSRLEKILAEGIAENHYHLNGSSQCFPLNWVSMMNYPDLTDLAKNAFKTNLQSKKSFGFGDNVVSWDIRIFWAECIRLYLFKRNKALITKKDYKKEFNKLKSNLSLFTENEVEVKRNKLINELEAMRQMYGVRLSYDLICLDYALGSTAAQEDIKYNRILVGERQFMYECFINCFSGEFTNEEADAYYLYLLIKSNFRGEIIQINNDIGFRNFRNYQDRKLTIPNRERNYYEESIRLALNSVLHSQPIVSLEARVMPKKKPEQVLKTIKNIDRIYDECESVETFYPHNNSSPSLFTRSQRKYFFVLHYPKEKFRACESTNKPLPRNYAIRENNQKFTNAILQALESEKYLRDAIKGIDACSNEIGCRPEVFAVDFRTLRQVIPQKKASIFGSQELPVQLGITYHVGEDFLNITDGLRAIDEAISFIGLRHNDRIGHALALGINVEEYYKYKDYRIIMPKQDILDDAAWLLFRANELNISVEPGIERRLLSLVQEYIRYIYGDIIKHKKIRWDPYTYYCSWKLRGDLPDNYLVGEFKEHFNIGSVYFGYEKNHIIDIEDSRNDKDISALYYAYHFDPHSQERGQETDVFKITPDYIELVKKVQKEFRYMISEKGIMIECNPTSNYLIGTIEKYDMHPLTVFNNMGLEYREDKISDCAQICVSINTDDQGIFDTSLTNEYAVICAALDKKKDKSGRKVYSPEHIYQYIENIRKMGLHQSFGK